MATLKSIKKRIASVKNTQKITKAMKMVAAAKLRRAQSAVTGSRPFVNKLREVVEQILGSVSDRDLSPLLKPHESVKKARVYVFSSNRGLCGGFNSNLLRQADAFLKDLKKTGVGIELVVIGKKGREFFAARNVLIDKNILEWADAMSYEQALALTQELIGDYSEERVDEVYFIYNRFASAISQVPTVEKLLPLSLDAKSTYGIDYIYEPNRTEILQNLLPRYLASQVHKVHKESLASELGARMAAMENATKNASEMIGDLTLVYNRARQAAITTELLDIVNGAESLKG
jgi:F-type H+-transporting ATPase subunit gamma